MISAGKRNRRVIIQQRSLTQDTSGGQVETWTDVAPVWAAIEPLTAREIVAAQAVQSEVSHSITILWQPAFADPKAVAAMRIVYGTRIFNIAGSMNPEERNRELILTASEGMNKG